MSLIVLENHISRSSILPNQFTFAVGRSLLALGTLLSIICNDSIILFYSNSFIWESTPPSSLNQINLFYLLGYENIFYSKIIAIIILVSVIIGYLPKLTCFLHWWVSFSYLNSTTLIEGGDQIAMILTVFLIPIMIFSNRNRNHWRTSKRDFSIYSSIVQNITLSIIRIQMALLYLHAAVGKTMVAEWVNGTSLYYWFTHPTFGFPSYLGFLITPIINNELLLPLVTWGVIGLEFCMFGALFAHRSKYKYFLFLGVGFHLFIIFIHGLPNFFLAMVGGLVLYLGGFWLEFTFNRVFKKWKKMLLMPWFSSLSQYYSRFSDLGK